MSKNLLMLLVVTFGLVLSSCAPRIVATPASEACLVEPEVLTSSDGVAFVRTPEACFDNLPDWSYEAKYLEIDGLRQAYIDEGPADGEPILLLHGQPSWSYLYRYMIPVLVEGGHRVIAMDHVGMGRSDKPVDLVYHSFENHVDRLDKFVQELELKNLTVFAQDWGAITALYLLSTKQDTFDRFVLGNGSLPVIEKPFDFPSDLDTSNKAFENLLDQIPAKQPYFFDEEGNSLLPMPEGEGADLASGAAQWAAYARYSKNFKASKVLEGGTFGALTAEELAAYDAPFPTEITMAGPRSFPSLINELVGLSEPAMQGLTSYEKPFLTISGSNELGTAEIVNQHDWYIANIPGAAGQEHYRFRDASHFLQDDKGKEIAERINVFMSNNAR